MGWYRAYRQYGVTGLVDQRRGGNHAKLTPVEVEQIKQQVETYTPTQLLGPAACYGSGQFWTVPGLTKLIERDYQVKYQSATSYRTLFLNNSSKKMTDTAQEAPHTVWIAGDEASFVLVKMY